MTRLANATALVTGGAGFIGSHLVDRLVADAEVRVLDDLSTGRRENVHEDATPYVGDIRNENTAARQWLAIDVVFHHAAAVNVDRSVEAPDETHAVNVGGTPAVLEAARAADARAVLALPSTGGLSRGPTHSLHGRQRVVVGRGRCAPWSAYLRPSPRCTATPTSRDTRGQCGAAWVFIYDW